MSSAYAKHSQMEPTARGVRAYAAPVNRSSGLIAAFDPAAQGLFSLDAPPAPWIDLGWVENFQRGAATKYEALRTGPAANITVQCRTQPEARVEFDAVAWGKIQLALCCGTQQMNVLAEQPGVAPQPSGNTALPGSPVQSGSSLTEVMLTADQVANYNAGDVIAVDVDYAGTTGYIGSGAPGAYLGTALAGMSHLDLVRRVTFNVSRVCGKTATSLLLAQPLLAVPVGGMSVQKVVAFVDREGSSFFQEWSGLFVVAPDSGGRTCFYYPRLQAAASGGETGRSWQRPCSSIGCM